MTGPSTAQQRHPDPPLPTLRRRRELHAVCRLGPTDAIPDWVALQSACGAADDGIVCVVRSAAELSIVAPQHRVPAAIRAERDFVVLSVEGTIDFAVIGLLARLSTAVAAAGVPLLALSTFDTDHLLLREPELERAVAALRAAGFQVRSWK